MSIVDDGDHAQRILGDEFFQRILKELREDTKTRLMQTAAKDSDIREQLYHEFHAMKRLEEKFKTYSDRKVFFKKKGE
tara:strand:- start:210 stop:443 length:234 start_codon:yes stop_codon:yes gene_type:complete